MLALELGCLAIVALYVGARAAMARDRAAFLKRVGLLIVASWISENSVIHAYGFYAYNPAWSLFVDRVPLMIVTIWPVVIHSAWELAGHLSPTTRWTAGSLLVLADAWLIEPVAVSSGLWWWTQPGLFGVPPIGVLGWAWFAAICLICFEREKPLWVIVAAPLGVHALLLVTWWGALRWVSADIDPWAGATLAVVLSALITIRVRGVRVPMPELLLRVPAAGFFFVLLAMDARENLPLVVWTLAFAPPWLMLVWGAWK